MAETRDSVAVNSRGRNVYYEQYYDTFVCLFVCLYIFVYTQFRESM